MNEHKTFPGGKSTIGRSGLWGVLLMSACVFLSSFTSSSARADLEVHMKEIGTVFKALTKQASDATQNTDSSAKAARLNELFKLSLQEVPDTVASLTGAQRIAALNQYQAWIQKEADLALELKSAFDTNDNAKALSLLNDMASVKEDGHTEFKP